MIVGLVMAAGLGTRFGGNKMLHPIKQSKGESVAMGLQSALNVKPWVDEVICIVRPQDDALIKLYRQHGLRFEINSNYEEGLSSSFIAGIKAAPDASMWLIALGDMPFIQQGTFRQIKKAIDKGDQNNIIQTSLNKKPGHPVVFPSRLKDDLLALSADEGARSIVKKERLNLINVPVDDVGVHIDIDENKVAFAYGHFE